MQDALHQCARPGDLVPPLNALLDLGLPLFQISWALKSLKQPGIF